MIADLGTRRGVSIQEISQNSSWFNGYPWMTDDSSKFPIKSIEEIKLSNEEARLAKLEQLSVDIDPSFMPSGHLNVDKT